MMLTENRCTGSKTCSSATSPTTNLTQTGPGLNLGLRSERAATTRLNHVTAFCKMMLRSVMYKNTVSLTGSMFHLIYKDQPVNTVYETNRFYCEKHTTHINMLCGQSVAFFNLTAGSTYSYH